MIRDEQARYARTVGGSAAVVNAIDRTALLQTNVMTTELPAPLHTHDPVTAAEGTERLRVARVQQSNARRVTSTLSVVIPTLNEAANLPHVLARLPDEVDDLIIVDGNSVDDTVEVALALRPDARIVLQDGRGKGNALACGFAEARGDIIVMLDADGSTDPAEIPIFIEPLFDGADFVKGSRALPGGGSDDLTHLRSAGNRALTGTVNLLYGTRYTDLCYGYNAFWRHCLEHMPLTCDGFEVETLIGIQVARAGLDVREVPSHEFERLNGESNLNAIRDGWRVLRTILRERVRRTVRTASSGLLQPTLGEMLSATELET